MSLADLLVFLLLGSIAGYMSLRIELTRTRILLWIVLLFCPSLFVAWTLMTTQPFPNLLLLVVFIICAWLYLGLTHKDRQNPLESLPNLGIKPPLALTADALQDRANNNPPLLTKEEETTLRNCFPLSVFYLQAIAYQPTAIACRGMLRVTDRDSSAKAYKVVAENLRTNFGDRFLPILQEHPIAPEASPDTRYAFLIIPNPASGLVADASTQLQLAETRKQKFETGLAVILAIATAIATLLAGGLLALKIDRLEGLTLPTLPTTLLAGITYSLAIGFQIGAREIARFFVAKHYRLKLSLPYVMPAFGGLGVLGTFTGIRSYIPHRRALFDLAIAPNLVGLGIAIVMLTVGLFLSPAIALQSADSQNLIQTGDLVSTMAGTPNPFSHALIANFLPFEPKNSLLVAVLSRVITGNGAAIANLHPLALAGWTGLLLTAVSLIPIGALDGAHLIHGIFGDRKAILVGKVARLLLLITALVMQPWLRIYALLAFLFDSHRSPTLDNVTELNNWRDLLGLMLIGAAILIIIPVPKVILPLLNLK
ncbi:site-2 protease family protein [Tumidithrix elongata RA019]|uniref:Site-2 protease family protein n=1 Tax=Tumidithrix elongata BACA0141 TaxID=2716417 RepID=A0AAW9PUA0_9CYAN|nr:site-2 protease family protein [Tumidithrix elongata RA019]